MIYVSDAFELDPARVELRRNGVPVHVEPQVFALLVLLVENRERMVSKDEIIEKVWDGLIVSDVAVSSRIKSARQALGDDGTAQRATRTPGTSTPARPQTRLLMRLVATSTTQQTSMSAQPLYPPASGTMRVSSAAAELCGHLGDAGVRRRGLTGA